MSGVLSARPSQFPLHDETLAARIMSFRYLDVFRKRGMEECAEFR